MKLSLIAAFILGSLFACRTTRSSDSQENGTLVVTHHEDQAAVIYPGVTSSFGQSSYYVCYRKCRAVSEVNDVETLKKCPTADLHGDTLANLIKKYPALSSVLIGDGLVVYSNFDNINDDLGSDLVRKFIELRQTPTLRPNSEGYKACNITGSGSVIAKAYPRCWRATSEGGWTVPGTLRVSHIVVYLSKAPGQLEVSGYFAVDTAYTDKSWNEAGILLDTLIKSGQCRQSVSDTLGGSSFPD